MGGGESRSVDLLRFVDR
jgi:hypothetical protein